MVKYKQRCMLCRKNMVLMVSRFQRPICIPCQTRDFDKPIADPVFRKLFDIAPELYQQNYFLRDIKAKYLRFGNLTEKQVTAFKRVAEELKGQKTDKTPQAETYQPVAEKAEVPIQQPKRQRQRKKKKEEI